jgi:hypothetical protein
MQGAACGQDDGLRGIDAHPARSQSGHGIGAAASGSTGDTPHRARAFHVLHTRSLRGEMKRSFQPETWNGGRQGGNLDDRDPELLFEGAMHLRVMMPSEHGGHQERFKAAKGSLPPSRESIEIL